MNKSNLILCLFFITIIRADDIMDDDMEEFDDTMPESIADMDSTEFVKDLENYFESNPSDPLTVQEAIEVSIKIYSEATMEQIKEMEAKLEKEDAQLTDEEENLLYFKNHLQDYFHTHHQENVSQERLREVIKANEILSFLEKKMDEEEALINEDDEQDEHDEDDDGQFENDDDMDLPDDFDDGDDNLDDENLDDLDNMDEDVNDN